MASLIDKIQKKLSCENIQSLTKKSRNWLRKEVSTLTLPANVRGNSILRDKSRQTTNILPGRLYFYSYDPKTKDSLPYYDKFPLVLPIEQYRDSILGLNFHYIRPNDRILLMNKLYETLTDDCFDEKTKLRINYNLLQGASRYAAFKPCLKKYLFGHIRSKIIEVQAKDWEIALMLPVDFFASEKGPTPTRSKVYKDSEKMY